MTSHLTFEQFKAVTFLPQSPTDKQNMIIEAGAGAGKTKVLSERVKWLLTKAPSSMRLNPNQIFLVTFTNDAQKELKERIQSVLSSNYLKQYSHLIHISTIDSLFDSLVDCLFPLWWEKHCSNTLSYQMPPVLSLISENEVQRNLEKKVAHFLNDSVHAPADLSLIIDFILSGGFKKNNTNIFSSNNTFEDILKCMCQDHFLASNKESIRIVANKIHPATNSLIAKIHTIARFEYEKRIQNGQFTYADKTVFLRENLKNNLPISIKELIVDEYQDTNFLQHEILYGLVSNSKGRMVAVGDPKQSIYGFRGASVSVFKSLLEDKEWEHVVLNKNFRTQEKLLHEINTLSKLAFSWQNPRLPVTYRESFFYEEEQKKYIGENPLTPGKLETQENNLETPSLYIVTASIPPKTKEKLKLNELSLLAYAEFLKDFKIKENISWNEIVVLCEKNKQIKVLREAFLKFGLPVKNIDNSDNSIQENIEDHVALALTKCLAGKADTFDLYLIFMSPLVKIPLQECYDFFAQTKKPHPSIDKFFATIEEFQMIAKHNFFLAWQRLRWALVLESENNDKLFCANMNPFAKALFFELSNPNTRTLLELSISDPRSDHFILPNKLSSYSMTKQSVHTENQDDALEIKTIHKAKGLEWPYVCFYPKYGMQIQTGEFITSQSKNTLDISWLNQDVESLSVVKRIENANFHFNDSYTDEANKTVRFAEIRKQQEENHERQRVFYTALTRPQKKLILFQPTLHPSSKKGVKELATEKKDIEYNDYLEQDVFTKYLNLNFNFESPVKNQEPPPLKEVFLSTNHTIELTHYNLLEFNKTHLIQEDKILLSPGLNKNSHQDDTWIARSTSETTDPTINSSHKQPIINRPDIQTQVAQKKTQREKIHKGILFHAGLENKKANQNSLIYHLEKKSILCKRELEIWSKNSPLTGSKRNILDMLLILKSNYFFETFSAWRNSTLLEQIPQQYIALVIDYKTGQVQQEHVTQILNYMNLVTLLFKGSSLMSQIPDTDHIAVFGSIFYTKPISSEKLYLNNELLTPAFHNNQEMFYILPSFS